MLRDKAWIVRRSQQQHFSGRLRTRAKSSPGSAQRPDQRRRFAVVLKKKTIFFFLFCDSNLSLCQEVRRRIARDVYAEV